MNSATGEAVRGIGFSSTEGADFGYNPSGTYIDPAVTNISWEAEDVYSGTNKLCTFEVIIR